MARTHYQSHDEVCQALIEALHAAGHPPECVMAVGLRLVEWFVLARVAETRGDSTTMATVADMLHGAVGELVMEMHRFRNYEFPIEAED